MTLRQLNIVTMLVLMAMLAVACRYNPSMIWWGVALVVLVQISIIVYACMNISSGYFIAARCAAKTDDKVVALTFDDGPHPTYTAPILDTLKKYDVQAAFFCIGKNIKGNEKLFQRTDSEGHLIGNHSHTHDFWFDMFGAKKMLANLQQMDGQVNDVIGKRPMLFRPPYGVTTPNMLTAVKRGRYTTIGWSVRSFDTAINDKQKLLSRITDDLKPGDIILLHDSMEITAGLLPEIIETIKNKGFRIERPDKMLNVKAYA